jgi:hypothetical protein
MSTYMSERPLGERKPFTRGNQRSGPSPDKTAIVEKVRPELNLEKWAIWQPAKSKSGPTERVIQREISLANGNKLSARVEIGFTNRGSLSTEDQRTYYALIKHWEERGRADQQTYFSLRYLAKRLKKKWGTNVIDSLTDSLLRLRTVPFVWTNSYFDATTKETIETLDTFSIVSELRIIKRKADGVVNKEIGYFRFNDFILKNLIANHTKPLLLDTVLSFRSEVAQILYTYLDLIIADKTAYERRTKELFDDLGLEGRAYANRSNRKQVLERALKELQGAPLSTGKITSAALERTKDGKDYKLVIRKGAREPVIEEGSDAQEERGEQYSNKASPATKTEITIQAEELVRYFHQIFHATEVTHPLSTAVGQAVALIAQYGVEKAKYIVDFSSRVAPETKYRPQTFGGILHYASRALADFELRRLQREKLEKLQEEEKEHHHREQARAQAERESEARSEIYLEKLPAGERQALYDRVLAESRTRYSYLANWDEEALKRFMKRAMIRHARKILGLVSEQDSI